MPKRPRLADNDPIRTKRTLDDFDDDAIENAAAPRRPVKPAAATRPASTPAKAMPSTGESAEQRTSFGVYMHEKPRKEATAAFLADFYRDPTSPETMDTWIERAVIEHARRTPDQRRALAATLAPLGPGGNGRPRSTKMSAAAHELRDQAVAADARAGRIQSASAFTVEAMRLATNESRKANGGELPEPPAALPRKLTRPQ